MTQNFSLIASINNLMLLPSMFILGAIIGSFLNVVICRLPKILERQQHNDVIDMLGDNCNLKKDHTKFSLSYPRSHCPYCKHQIKFWQNIPIISYLLLRARCSNCKAKISLRYPLIELLTAILFICFASIAKFEFIILIAGLIFISYIICITFIGWDTLFIPDCLTLPLLWLGLIANSKVHIAISLDSAIIGAIFGYVFLFMLSSGLKIINLVITDDNYKLLAAIGAWLGYQFIPYVIFVTIILFLIQVIFLKLTNRFCLLHKMPLVSFIGISGIINLFWILSGYCHSFLG